MRDFTNIQAWQLADDLTVAVYNQSRSWPSDEMYGLISQIRRAVSSVPANIAEGAARESKKDYLHFLYIARGSLAEAQYFVHLARRLGYLDQPESDRLTNQARQTFACLLGLIHAVEREAAATAKSASAHLTPVS